MSALSFTQSKLGGVAVAFVAASSGGDTVPAADHGTLLVNNASGSSINVTLTPPGKTRYGVAQPAVVVPVPAGSIVAIGPFDPTLADYTTDGRIHITYSAVGSVTVAAVSA